MHICAPPLGTVQLFSWLKSAPSDHFAENVVPRLKLRTSAITQTAGSVTMNTSVTFTPQPSSLFFPLAVTILPKLNEVGSAGAAAKEPFCPGPWLPPACAVGATLNAVGGARCALIFFV